MAADRPNVLFIIVDDQSPFELKLYNPNSRLTENGNWNIFTIVSVGFSAGGFMYTCLKLLWAIDMIKHYENEQIQKQRTKIIAIRNEDFEEVYNSDFH